MTTIARLRSPALLFLVGSLALYGCEQKNCKHPCLESDPCPDLTGSYPVTIEQSFNDCYGSLLSYQEATFRISRQTPEKKKTTLAVSLNVFNAFLDGQGELCNTLETETPQRYSFSAGSAESMGEVTETTDIGGLLILTDQGLRLCASINISLTDQDGNACVEQAIFYTHLEDCQ